MTFLIYCVDIHKDAKVKPVIGRSNKSISLMQLLSKLSFGKRMGRQWVYVLLSENVFYTYSAQGASINDICTIAKVQKNRESIFE